MGPSEIRVWRPMIVQHCLFSSCPSPSFLPLQAQNILLPACIWVTWVSFPSLLTANFDVSLLCWHQKPSHSHPSPILAPSPPSWLHFLLLGYPLPFPLAILCLSLLHFLCVFILYNIVNKIAFFFMEIIYENTPR